VADQVTAPEKTPEEIEREMAETRAKLTEKVSALEHQVVGTVQNAANTVNNTVETVKSLVSNAPDAVGGAVKQAAAAVGEAMKSTFDFSGHVRKNPLPSVGVSALLGALVGYLTGGRGSSVFPSGPMPAAVYSDGARSPQPAAAPAVEKPGMFDDVIAMVTDKAKELARTALESVSAAVKSNIQTGIPGLVNDAATAVGDRIKGEPEPFSTRLDAPRYTG